MHGSDTIIKIEVSKYFDDILSKNLYLLSHTIQYRISLISIRGN